MVRHYDPENGYCGHRDGAFWMHHNPGFCISGATFSQPVRTGLLRDEFNTSDCGSLDAPEYICIGGIRGDAARYEGSDTLYISEDSMTTRDRMAWRAEPPQDDDWDWGDDCGEYLA